MHGMLFYIIYHLQTLYRATLTHLTIKVNVVIIQQKFSCSHFNLHGVLHSDKLMAVVFKRNICTC